MEDVKNPVTLKRALLTMWDAVIDLQDQVSEAISLLSEQMPPPEQAPAWVLRPGQEPEKVDLVQYAREVAGYD